MKENATIDRRASRGIAVRLPVIASVLTVALIAFTAFTFWHTHETEQQITSRLAVFDRLVWEASLVHDARVAAAVQAMRARDTASRRRYERLATDAVDIARGLSAMSDVASSAPQLPAKAMQLRVLERDLLAAPARPTSQQIELYTYGANAYRTAVMIVDHDGKKSRMESRIRNVDRSRRLGWSVLAVLAALASGWIVLVRLMRRHLAARRDAEERYERANLQNRLILEATADGIIGVDAKGSVTFVNPSAALMLAPEGESDDFSRAEAMRVIDRVFDLLSPALLNGAAVVRREFDLVRRDGTTLHTAISASPLHDQSGRVAGGVLAIHDITERHELERMKSEFVATVSHELRTPLTSIRGALGLVTAGHFGQLAEKGQRMLNIALRNTDRLVRLINDILDIERLDSGAIELNRTDVNAGDLVASVVETMAPLAAKSDIRLRAHRADVTVSADADRISQVLTNLIGNAIKFSEPGSSIDVGVSADGGNARFSVRDHGRGIPADKLEAIFERFQQVDATDAREKGGTGLGLSICRSIVALHKGEITAESQLGAGSTFSFVIPASHREAPLAEVIEIGPARAQVLVCEDDAQTLEVLSAMLQLAGYGVIGARSGEEAVAQAAALQPDAILMDIVLPGISGWEAIAQLRANAATARIPVIVLSGLSRPNASGDSDNIAAWIEKPAGGDEIHWAIDDALASNLRRVVIAEDDADLGSVLVDLFQRDGMTAELAASGTEAVDLISRADPDLVVLDLGLPGLDGFEVFDWMRRRRRWANTPIVIYSARELNGVEADRFRQGPTELLVKGKIAPEQFEREAVRLLHAMVGVDQETRNEYQQRAANR